MISSPGVLGELGLALIVNFGIKTTANVVERLLLRFPGHQNFQPLLLMSVRCKFT